MAEEIDPSKSRPTEPTPSTPPLEAKPLRPEPPDPFDPAALRLAANYSEGLGVKRVITTIPCRKPNKTEWFRVRPGDGWRMETTVFETEGVDRATYLVVPALRDLLGENLSAVLLLMCVNRSGDPFLWRVKLPGPDGRANLWSESALRAASEAETSWCRMTANMAAGGYSLYTSASGWSDPQWPDLTYPEVLRIAFRDRMIDSPDHPVLRELRGLS